jgi:hypothetical protein
MPDSVPFWLGLDEYEIIFFEPCLRKSLLFKSLRDNVDRGFARIPCTSK